MLNGQLILNGDLISLDEGKWHPYLAKLNLFGDTIWSKTYLPPAGEQVANDLIITNEGFAITGFDSPTSLGVEGNAYVQSFNHDGVPTALHAAGDTTYNTDAQSLWKTEDGGYLLGGTIGLPLPGSHRPYLTKVSADGVQLWQHQFTDGFFEQSSIRVLLPGDSGSFYLLGFANLDWGSSNTGDIFLMQVDSLGLLLWDTLYNPGTVDQITDAIRTKDGGMLLVGQMNGYTGIAMKLKPDFTVDWVAENVNDECGTKGIVETEDGSFVMSGCTDPPGQSRTDLSLLKLDADGERLWHRFYGKPFVHDYGYNMTATPDGGYIVCGRADTLIAAISTYYADVYLVKTNCMGLLTEPEAAFNYDAVDAYNVQFINQSQFVYPDSTDGGRYLWSFGDGTTSEELHPQHTFPEVAEYEVTLTAIVCSDTSVYTETVSTTPTGINPRARAESIMVLPPSPNPAASGLPIRIGVEFPHFIQNKTATVRLYDINGRLLHQGKQIGGGVYELPTSGLTGVYLYGVEWEGNVLQRGKLTLF